MSWARQGQKRRATTAKGRKPLCSLWWNASQTIILQSRYRGETVPASGKQCHSCMKNTETDLLVCLRPLRLITDQNLRPSQKLKLGEQRFTLPIHTAHGNVRVTSGITACSGIIFPKVNRLSNTLTKISCLLQMLSTAVQDGYWGIIHQRNSLTTFWTVYMLIENHYGL